MTQNDFLNNLREAKAAHIRWHALAKQLAMGLSNDDNLPKMYTDCTFGKWFYRSGQFISNLPGFSEIEPLHIELHDTYAKIYQMYLSPVKKKLFSSTNKAEKIKTDNLNLLVDDLKKTSTALIDKIDKLEKSILSFDKDEFVNVIITPQK